MIDYLKNNAFTIVLILLGIILINYLFKKNMSIEQKILAAAKSKGMPSNMQRLILAQAKHETANFSSNAFKKNNNLFGYKAVSGAKWQIGNGITSSEGNAYAAYSSIEHSVYELCDWITRRQAQGKFPVDLTTITTPEMYATLLKNSSYYGDTVANYTKGLKHFLS